MDSSDNTCLVCHEIIEIYAIGVCDHAICFKCSTRLRALCEQFYCPICRRDLPEVFFMSKRESFGQMPVKSFIQNKKLKILFENQEIRGKFEQLLEHRCKICKNRYPEKSFRALKDHMSRVHTLFFCNLCLELKIFTSERKAYTRQDLATHRRQGDKDDTSYKGHPLCEFCDERYLDKDELYKHLRKDHYFCHFCESLGSQDFFDNYEVLRQHFQKEHFLCEEGECATAQFENAFKSKIDYQSHIVTHHGKSMTKQQSKQERTINIDINLVPRPTSRARGILNGQDYEENRRDGASRYQGGRRGGRGGKYKRNMDREDRDMERAVQASLSTMKEKKPKARQAELEEVEEDQKPNLHDVENFPSLGVASSSVTDIPTSQPNNASEKIKTSLADRLALANNMSVMHGTLAPDEFPDLKPKPKSAPISKSLSSHTSDKTTSKKTKIGGTYSGAALNVNSIEEEFPELPQSKMPIPESSGKWKKQESVSRTSEKPSNVRKPVQKSDLSSIGKTMYTDSDFPSLGGESSKTKQPVNSKWFKSSNNASNNKKVQKTDSAEDDSVPVSERFSPIQMLNSESPDNKVKNKKKKKKDKTESVKEKENIKSNSSLDNIASMLLSNANSSSSENVNVCNKASTEEINKNKVKGTDSKSTEEKNSKKKDEKQLRKEDKIEKKFEAEQTLSRPIDFETPETDNERETAPVKFSIEEDDFPSLGATTKPIRNAPPGFAREHKEKIVKAPPGLKKAPGSAPPPGFDVSNNIKNDVYNKESVLVASHLSNFEYTQPDGFSERNKLLIACIQALCSDRQNTFSDFKVLSGEFRKGEINAVLYYERCQEILGKKNFSEIFPELLALLPDIEKQQQLLAVFMEHEGMKKDDGVLKISGKSRMAKGAWTVSESGFLTCQTCRQVLQRKDYNNHVSFHAIDNDFPSLGCDVPSSTFRQGAWVRAK